MTQEDEGLSHPERIALVRRHFQNKGYRVHSGLQFGCELVLYADSPGLVHSDFCVHVPAAMMGGGGGGGGTIVDWRTIQTLVRSMPDLRKTLIVARVCRRRRRFGRVDSLRREGATKEGDGGGDGGDDDDDGWEYEVDELAIATEHAPFRHKNIPLEVGTQVKPQAPREHQPMK